MFDENWIFASTDSNMNQNYNPKEWEEKIYQQWEKQKVGEVRNDSYEAHTILMPPPNLTGNLHAGHAFQHYLMDTLTRIYRQKGVDALWVPGVDHAGIQLEGVIDKMFKTGEADKRITKEMRNHLEFPKDKEDIPKFLKKYFLEDWLEFAWSKVDEWRDFQKNQAKVLGDTPDYSRNLFTLDKRAVDMVNHAFVKYWEDGLIYKKSYLINWSVGLQTALSDVPEDIGRETRKDPFVTIEYEVYKRNGLEKTDYKLKIQTVRPETIFADQFVLVNENSKNISEDFKNFYRENNNMVVVKLPLTEKYLSVILLTTQMKLIQSLGLVC
ncbi:class I tRNA ligase family protein [Candidatus Gracilibacteria bacterium]|nr:class I tRNA ligase family protein [Candidatus Gracilibacteria bacterium]